MGRACLVLLALSLPAAVSAQELFQLLLNPVPGEGMERGSLPFMFRPEVADFGGKPYMFLGRGNAYDIYRMDDPQNPQKVASLTGRVPLVDTSDRDWHIFNLAINDDDPVLFAPYYNLGSATQQLDSATAPASATTVVTYALPAANGSIYPTDPNDFVTHPEMFKDLDGNRYLIGRNLGDEDLDLPMGIYRYPSPEEGVTRLRDMPLGDNGARNSQNACAFEAPAGHWKALIESRSGSSGDGSFFVADLADVDDISTTLVEPPDESLDDILGFAIDRDEERFAAAFTDGSRLEVGVYDGTTTPPALLATGVLPGARPPVYGFNFDMRGGVIAVTAMLAASWPGSWDYGSFLAAFDPAQAELSWYRIEAMDHQGGVVVADGEEYQITFSQTAVFPLPDGTGVVIYRGGKDAAEFWSIPCDLFGGCGPACGNGVVEEGESCDGDCPTSCEPPDACRTATLIGSADTCDVTCSFAPITTCNSGDGCCPSGCSREEDADCAESGDGGGVTDGDTDGDTGGDTDGDAGGCGCSQNRPVGLAALLLLAVLVALRRARSA